VWGEPAVTVDPLLNRLRVVRQHIRGVPIARHLDASRIGFVEIGRVKAETGPRCDADSVEGHDPENKGAGGVADPVNDDPFAAVADGGVFELVLMDEAAVVVPDAIIGERGAARSSDHASRARDKQEELRETQTPAPHRHVYAIMSLSSGRNLTRGNQGASLASGSAFLS